MIDEKRWDRLLNSIKMSIFMNCDLIDLNHGSDKWQSVEFIFKAPYKYHEEDVEFAINEFLEKYEGVKRCLELDFFEEIQAIRNKKEGGINHELF